MGENIELNLKVGFKSGETAKEGSADAEMKELQDKQKAALATARVKCRKWDHFVSWEGL